MLLLAVVQETPVLAEPHPDAAEVGRIPLGSVARVTEQVDGPGCEAWSALEPYGYACLDGAEPTDREPEALPDVVSFDAPEPDEYFAYVETGEPMDKAGAYAIQGIAAVFIEYLEGSYSGVMGLPLFETAQLLREAGLELI